MSTRSVVVLLAVALTLAAMVMLFERQVSQETKPSEDEYKVFKEYRAEQVQKVSLIDGNLAVQLLRDVEGWQMRSPVMAVADEQRVQALLGRLGELMEVAQAVKAKPGEQVNLKEYGLDDPSRRIIVSYGGVAEAALSLGNRVVSGDQLYARLGKENRVMIIDAEVSKLLDEVRTDANYYRSRRIFQPKHVDKALDIQLLGAGGDKSRPIVLHKDDQSNLWVVSSPLKDRADQEAVEQLLGRLADLRTIEFISLPPNKEQIEAMLAEFGLGRQGEAGVLAVAAEGYQTVYLHLGRTDKQGKLRYAFVDKTALLAGSQEVVKLAAECVDILPKSLGTLRDRKFLRFEDKALGEVRLSGPKGVTVLARTKVDNGEGRSETDSGKQAKNGWTIKEPREMPADENLVNGFLEALRGLQATSVVGTEEVGMGFAEPYFSVKVQSKENLQGGMLEVAGASEDGKSRYARLKGDAYVRKVPVETVEQLVHGYLYFHQRQIAQVGSWDVKRFEISIAGQAKRQGEHKQGQWWLTEPTAVRAENDVVRDVLGILDPLQAGSIVADDVDDSDSESLARYGLAEPWIRLSVAKKAEQEEGSSEPAATEEYVLLLGKAEEDGLNDEFYARLEGSKLIFTLPGTTVSKLDDDLRSRKVLPIANWQIRQLKEVEIVRGSEVLKLVKTDDNWQVVSPRKFRPNEEAVKELLESLPQLQSGEFAEYVDDEKYGLANPTIVLSVTLEQAGKAEQKTYRCFVGKQVAGKGYAVKDEDEQVVRLVDAEKLEKVQQGYLAYHKKQMLSLKKKDIKIIEIVEKGKKQRAQRQDAGWRLISPESGALELSKVDAIVELLRNLQAVTVVAEGDEAVKKYGLDKPVWTVNVELIDEWGQSQRHSLLLGAEFREDGKKPQKNKPEARYAKLADGPVVFVLSGENVEIVKKGLVFRPAEDN